MYKEITTVDKAFETLKLNINTLPDVSLLPEKDREPILNHYKIVKTVEAINEGWQPNWGDRSEYKYVLWPDIEKDESKASGFGFSNIVWAHTLSYTTVGSHLCFQSRDKAKHFFDHFQELFESYMLIAK